MNIKRKYYIYLHKNKINNKVYIGYTTQPPKKRWGSNGINYRKSKRFYSAIQKYGWDNFEHIILEEGYATGQEISLIEQDYIKKYDSTNIDKGYNINPGGFMQSEEVRKKNSEAHKGSKNHFAVTIGMYDENWVLERIFSTRKEALEYLGILNHHRLTNARKTGEFYRGHYWKDIK